MSVLKTRNYEIFKISKGNRPINQVNLEKIKSSIQHVNALEQCPIIVSSNFFVIDGQHRLEAAKQLGLEVFYSVTDHNPDELMVLLNVAKKGWGYDDWIHHWAGKGLEPYIKIIEISNLTGRSVYEITRLFQGNRRGAHIVKEGRLQLLHDDTISEGIEAIKKSDEIINHLYELSMKRYSFLRSNKFKEALFYFIKRDGVIFEELSEKMVLKLDIIRPCTTAASYGEMIFDIYNFGRKNKLGVPTSGGFTDIYRDK